MISACQSVATVVVDNPNTDEPPIIEQRVEIELDFDPTKGIVTLIESSETGLYYLATESRTGNILKEAIVYYSDGTSKIVTDLREFAIANNIIKVVVDFESGVPLDGFELNANNYNGYYLGNSYKLQIKTRFSPENASNKTLKYFSTNENVVSVTNQGELTIKSPGFATITVLSLEGNHRQQLIISIKDGRSILKDSLSSLDIQEEKLLGNRYDDNSVQESTFESATIGSFENEFIVAGYSNITNDRTIATVSKFSFFSTIPSARLNLDSEDKYYSEWFYTIDYSASENVFYAAGKYQATEDSEIGSLIARISEVKNEEISAFRVDKIVTRSEGIERVYTNVTSDSNFVIAVGYYYESNSSFFLNLFGINGKQVGFIDLYDHDLTFIKSINLNNANKYDVVKINPYNGQVILSGNNDTSAFILEWDYTTDEFKAFYYSELLQPEIIDVELTSPSNYIIAGNGVINDKKISFVGRVIKTDAGEFLISNSVKNEIYQENFAVRVFFHNGIISVLGYGADTISTGILRSRDEEYSIVSNFNERLEVLGNGVKFLNGNTVGDRGTKQRFNDAVITSFSQMIGVGRSNYFNKDYDNAYVQLDIRPVS